MNIHKEIHFTEDISIKYSIMIFNKRLHQYLNLKGEYLSSYPTEVITRDIRNFRMDGLYKTSLKCLNNIEGQSKSVKEKEIKRFAIYKTFAEYTYSLPVNLDKESLEKINAILK